MNFEKLMLRLIGLVSLKHGSRAESSLDYTVYSVLVSATTYLL